MRQITTLTLLLTFLLGMVTASHGQNAIYHDADISQSAHQGHDDEKLTQDHCNGCPCAPEDSHADHNCGHACCSPCHAPLPNSPIDYTCALLFITIHPAEITWYIPKVYLSLLVPPDIATI